MGEATCSFSHVGYPLSQTVLDMVPDVGVKKSSRKWVHSPVVPVQLPRPPPAGLVLLPESLEVPEHQGILGGAVLRFLIYWSVVVGLCHQAWSGFSPSKGEQEQMVLVLISTHQNM